MKAARLIPIGLVAAITCAAALLVPAGASAGLVQQSLPVGHHPPLGPTAGHHYLAGRGGVGMRGLLVRQHDHADRPRYLPLQPR